MMELGQCWVEGASGLRPTASPSTSALVGPLPPDGALPGSLYPTGGCVLHGSGYPEPWPPARQLLPSGQAQCQAHTHSR